MKKLLEVSANTFHNWLNLYPWMISRTVSEGVTGYFNPGATGPFQDQVIAKVVGVNSSRYYLDSHYVQLNPSENWSLTPEEEHTLHRLKDLLRWRDARKETPEDEQNIVCWSPKVASCEAAWAGQYLAPPNAYEEGVVDHPHFSSIAWAGIEQWRVYVPGIDAPPSETIDPLAETGAREELKAPPSEKSDNGQ